MTGIAGIYAIIDPQYLPAHWTVRGYAEALLRGGCPVIQLRVKGADADVGARRLAWTHELMALKDTYDFCCIVNDDAACARDAGADGVHVGKVDTAIAVARAIVGPDRLIGFSAHALDEARAAANVGADYVALGAIYPTATKGPGHPVQGCARLRDVVATVPRPVVAIGGITRANVADVAATGVSAAAMITGLAHADDPTAEVRWYTTQWQQRQPT